MKTWLDSLDNRGNSPTLLVMLVCTPEQMWMTTLTHVSGQRNQAPFGAAIHDGTLARIFPAKLGCQVKRPSHTESSDAMATGP